MRLIVAALSLVVVSACSKTPEPVVAAPSNDVRAPVNVAASLYGGCLVSHLATLQPMAKPELDETIAQLDDNCLAWTVIWYEPLMGKSVAKLDDDSLKRFDKIRNRLLDEVEVALALK